MNPRAASPYIGRFAPSPTGPLHFGSLVAAAASYLQARSQRGRWLLRVEDIDPPRQQAGADDLIVDALRRYGFFWDGNVSYQSQSFEQHEAALNSLLERSLAYPCSCSRKDLADAPSGALGLIYPGTCRNGCHSNNVAIRVRTDNESISFDDGLQGRICQRLESESGDFVIRRKDKLIAYHLAVVVDDHLQGVTEVIRGIDLIDSTARQIWLQQLLGYETPEYAHIPVITHPNGDKFSKLTGATAISNENVEMTLIEALSCLGQSPPANLGQQSLQEIWHWAIQNWRIGTMKRQTAVVKTS